MTELNLETVLAAMDMGARTLWNELAEEDQKNIKFFTLNRYASWVDGSYEDSATAVLSANEYLNKHFYLMSEYPEIMWHLACMTTEGDRVLEHRWVKPKTGVTETKLMKQLRMDFPEYNDKELELLMKKNSRSDIIEHLRDMGLSDKVIESLC